MSSILQKPARDLSAEDYAAIRKPLGKRVPYPMVGLGYVINPQNGEKKLTRYLGTLEKPLMVTSERSLDEIEGNLIRDMPTPEMLPMFFEIMSAIDPKNKRRSMLLVGAPGSGKTFMGELAGRISHEKGAITVDCTGMNLNELFFETVLDFNASQNFYDAIAAKIEKYNLLEDQEQKDKVFNPLSIDILTDCLGSSFSKEGGKICIDWEGVRHAHTDENGTPLETRKNIEIAIAGLLQVSKKEGLDNLGGNALGMATQEGVAWQAYKEGRVLILDELNRAKRGTFGIIHGWMQFMIGEKPDCRVRNPLKEKGDQTKADLVFRREEMGAGHFVFGTSNELEDSDEVLELPEALSSRMVPQHVPKASLQGWQHRLCQILTGLPISTLYNAQSDVWDENPAEFGRKLKEWRALEEHKEIPEHQLTMIHRWKDIMQATENLATFLDAAGKTIDPDSDWHKAGTLTQLLDDIDESFKKEVSVDFRKISYFLNKAFQAKPSVRVQQGDDAPNIVPLISEMDMPDNAEDIRHRIGTHMTYVIMDWIVSVSFERGKEDLGNQLMRLASDCALIDPQLIEGMSSNRKTVAELLDGNPFDSEDPDTRIELVRDLLCDYLRNSYPDMEADNDEIMPQSVVKRAIEDIARQGSDPIVFNDNPDNINQEPLQRAKSLDMISQTQRDAQNEPMVPAAEQLLSQYALLASLATPEFRTHNLSCLWTESLSNSGVVHSGEGDLVDDSLAMAENKSETGVAATTIMVRKDQDENGAKEIPLHIVWNQNIDRVLVIGEGEISQSLKRAFNDARIVYIDRSVETTRKNLQGGLSFVLGAETKSLCNTVRHAFLMRNALPTQEEEAENDSLSQLLLNKDLKCFLPHYLVKMAA